jgi:hypothetical protein
MSGEDPWTETGMFGSDWYRQQDARFCGAMQRAIDRGWERTPVVTIDEVVSVPKKVSSIRANLP